MHVWSDGREDNTIWVSTADELKTVGPVLLSRCAEGRDKMKDVFNLIFCECWERPPPPTTLLPGREAAGSRHCIAPKITAIDIILISTAALRRRVLCDRNGFVGQR